MYYFGPAARVRPIGNSFDVARNWQRVAPEELAKFVNIDDFDNAWARWRIDPIRLYRHYNYIGLFRDSVHHDKVAADVGFTKDEAWHEAIGVVRGQLHDSGVTDNDELDHMIQQIIKQGYWQGGTWPNVPLGDWKINSFNDDQRRRYDP